MIVFKNDTAADEAVEFLVSRIAEQARRDSVPLTEAELKQLVFTEENATQEDSEAVEAFDSANDSDEFEAKITRLLRSAYRQDVKAGRKAIWEQYLSALDEHDVYVLVMVDMAGIPHKWPKVEASPIRGWALPEWSLSGMLRLLRSGLIWLWVGLGAVYFFFLPPARNGAPGLFGDLAERLIRNDGLRGALLLIWIAGCAGIWLFSRKYEP